MDKLPPNFTFIKSRCSSETSASVTKLLMPFELMRNGTQVLCVHCQHQKVKRRLISTPKIMKNLNFPVSYKPEIFSPTEGNENVGKHDRILKSRRRAIPYTQIP